MIATILIYFGYALCLYFIGGAIMTIYAIRSKDSSDYPMAMFVLGWAWPLLIWLYLRDSIRKSNRGEF